VVDEPDDEFLDKFQKYQLTSWDHRTHLRLAWLYLTKLGRREGMKMIFTGIKNFIDNSPVARKTTFHETMTYFWTHMVHFAIMATKNPTGDFVGFLLMNPQLSNGGMFLEFYNKDTMLNNPTARKEVVLPDKKPLPSIISKSFLPSQQKAMETITTDLVDDEFLDQFTKCSLTHWDHTDFLRVVWLVLHKEGRKKGIDIILNGVKKFIETSPQTKTKKFHFTQTYFWIQLMDYEMSHPNVKDFESLLQANPDFLKPRLFLDYYKIDTILNNPESEKQLVLPDKKPFPNIRK